MQKKVKRIKIIQCCHGSLGGTSVPIHTLSQERKIKYMSDLVKVYSSSATYIVPAFI